MRCQDEWPNVPELVQIMFDAQNGSCGYCGVPMFIRREVPRQYYLNNKHMAASFEHINPHSEGGKYELSNGACVCNQCNTLRGNMPLEEFFERYEELLQYLFDKPARDRAKAELNAKKNGYIIAWYAKHTGQTLADIFLVCSNHNSYEMARNF